MISPIIPSPPGSADLQDLGGLLEDLGEAGDGGDGGPLQLAVDELVILHQHVAGPDHLQGVVLVQTDDGVGGDGAGPQESGPHGGHQLAGALEVQTGGAVLHLGELQELRHGIPHQDGVHGVGVELAPEVHQGLVGQIPGGAADLPGADGVHGGGVAVAVPVSNHVDGVGHVHPIDVGPDLLQGHGEEVQPLELDGLVGGHQHPAPLVELHQVLLGGDPGLGDGRPLGHHFQGLVVGTGGRGDGPVVHAADAGLGGGEEGEDVALLHALTDRPGHIFREEDGRLPGGKELGDHIGVRPLHLDIKALELPLEGVQMLQRGPLVLLRGVALLQDFGKGGPGLAVHPLVQLHGFKLICHVSHFLSGPSYRNRPMVLSAVFRFTTRQFLPVSPEAARRMPPEPSATRLFQPRLGAAEPL